MLAAEPEFSGGEQPIDDHVVASYVVIYELGTALRPDDPERRHLALADAGGELEEHLAAVIECA